MRLSRSGLTAAAVGATVVAAIVISPAIGGPSLKKLVKREVSKQLANKQGPAGQQGAAGAAFAANSTLRSGETLTGVWAASGTGPAAGAGAATDTIQFAPQLPTDLGAGAVHRLAIGNTSAACPGPGLATAGNLCVYEKSSSPAMTFNFIGNPALPGTGADRRGAVIHYNAPQGSTGAAEGTWAVTAP